MTVLRMLTMAIVLLIAMEVPPSANECDAGCRAERIEACFERLSAVYRRGSTTDDVDRLFDLFAPDVRYVHAAYDADFAHAAWREAFLANLTRGAYDKGDDELIEVTQVIHGRRHAAVEYRYVRRASDGTLQPADDQGGLLVLFAFEGDRIVLIEEYW